MGVLFIAFCVSIPVKVYAEDAMTEYEIIEEQINTDEIDSIEDKLKGTMDEEFYEILPDYDPESLIRDVSKGDFKFDITSIFNKVLLFLFKEVYINIDILIKLVVLVIICAVLNNLQASFMSKSVGELAFYVCYIVLVSILMKTNYIQL